MLQLIHTSIAALEKIGLPKDAIAPFFIPRLRESIPVDLYLEFRAATRWEKVETHNNVSASTILNANQMDRLLQFIEDIVADLDEFEEHHLKQLQGQNSKKLTPTAIALKTEVKTRTVRTQDHSQKPSVSGERISCVFCKSEEHRTQACSDTATTVQQKREVLINENRCIRCSKKGHRAAVCRSAPECGKCKKKGHMTPLCNPLPTFTAHCSHRGKAAGQPNGSNQISAQYFITVTAVAIGPKGDKEKCEYCSTRELTALSCERK